MKSSDNKTFLYYQAAEKIKNLIHSERLNTGSYLPSERKLAAMFGVAFLTVRKSLAVLAEAGIIRKIPSRGSMVTKIPELRNSSGLRRRRIGVTIWAEAGINHPATQNLLNLSGAWLPADKYEIVVIFINNKMVEKDDWEQLLNPDNLDGMLITVQEIPPYIIEKLRDTGVPAVFLNFPGIMPGGWCDYLSGMDQLINYFISLGHRNIAFISGDNKSAAVRREIEVFQTCCGNHNLPVYENSVIKGEFSEKSGYESMLKLLEGAVEWDAVLLGDDYMAMGALKAVRLMGLSCPGDISISCFEGCFVADQLSPPLTVISNLRHELSPSVRCLEMLKSMIENNLSMKDQFFTYRPELIIRGSTAVKKPKNTESTS